MGDGSDRPVFQQSGWTVHGAVYNVAGDLVLSKDSSTADLVKVLGDLRQQVARLSDLDPDRRRQVERDLDEAAREAARDRPVKDAVVGRLQTVRAVLEAASTTVGGALSLAKSVAQVAGWVAGFLA
jgi:hypothetical protein